MLQFIPIGPIGALAAILELMEYVGQVESSPNIGQKKVIVYTVQCNVKHLWFTTNPNYDRCQSVLHTKLQALN